MSELQIGEMEYRISAEDSYEGFTVGFIFEENKRLKVALREALGALRDAQRTNAALIKAMSTLEDVL